MRTPPTHSSASLPERPATLTEKTENLNAKLNVKTKGSLKRNARFLKGVEVVTQNLNANLNVEIKGSLTRNHDF